MKKKSRPQASLTATGQSATGGHSERRHAADPPSCGMTTRSPSWVERARERERVKPVRRGERFYTVLLRLSRNSGILTGKCFPKKKERLVSLKRPQQLILMKTEGLRNGRPVSRPRRLFRWAGLNFRCRDFPTVAQVSLSV